MAKRSANVSPYRGDRDRPFPYEHTDPTEVPLGCGHVVHFKPPVPEPGKPVWCRRCGRYVSVAI